MTKHLSDNSGARSVASGAFALAGAHSPPRLRYWALAMLSIGLIACSQKAQGQQPPEEPPTVYLDVSIEARNRLGMVDSYIRESEWVEAVELLQTLIENFGDKVVPTGPESAGSYVNLRTFCHHKISQLPADGLRLYRERVDSQALDLLKKSEQSGDMSLLQRIVDEYFCSTVAPKALDRLGDRAMSRGHYVEAMTHWSKILPRAIIGEPEPAPVKPAEAKQENGKPLNGNPAESKPVEVRLRYPDPKIDAARIGAKWIIAQVFQGNEREARRAIAALRVAFPDTSGTLAGTKAPYWEIATQVASNPAQYVRAPESADWLTFAGNSRRSKIAPTPLDVGAVQWKWSFAEEARPQDGGAFNNFEDRLRTDERLVHHPVIVGNLVLLATDRYLWTFDLATGSANHWYDFENEDQMFRSGRGGRSRYTLTVAGNRLFVRAGGSSTNMRQNRIFGGNRATAASKLYCFDFRAQRLLWDANAQTVGDQNILFEGSPVVEGNSVYIAMTRIDAMSETSVVCFDVESGEVRWKTLVCESTNDAVESDVSTHNLLTLADDTIYYCTNLGALAAIHARTGKLRWVSTYARGRRQMPGYSMSLAPDLNPCVVDGGKVFMAASDTSKIQCYDAETGRKLWDAHLPVVHVLGVAKGNLIATSNRVWGIDVETGKVKWYWPENPVSGSGRGLLAGDFVYWPTKTEIHVLDQATGRKAQPSVALFERLRLKGGNLAVGSDYLVLTQTNRLLAIVPHRRLIQKLQQEVVKNPTSAELHLRLAQAAFDSHEYPLATESLRQTIKHAKPEQVFQGKSVVALAKEKLFESLMAEATERAAAKEYADAQKSFDGAVAEAATDDARLSAKRQNAQMWLTANEPARAVAIYQSVIDSPLASLLVEGPASAKIAAGAWASDQVRDLIARHGRSVYAPFDRAVADAAAKADGGDELLAVARRFPNASARGRLLLTAGQAFEKSNRHRDARLAYKRLVREPQENPAAQLQSLLGLQRAYRAERLSQPNRVLLERLLREFGDKPLPEDSMITVADYARRQLESLSDEDSLAGKPGSEIALLSKSWNAPSGEGTLLIPAGSPPAAEWEAIFRLKAGTLTCCSPRDGKSIWEVPVASSPQWLAHSTAGMLLGDADRIACHGYDSGNLLWEVSLRSTGVPAPWVPIKSSADANIDRVLASAGIPADNEARQELHLTAPSGGPSLPFATIGDFVWAIQSEKRLLAIDIDEGAVVWEVPFDEPLLPAIRTAGSALCVATADRLYGIDPLNGNRRFDVARKGNLPTLQIAPAADKIVAVTDRSEISAIDGQTGKASWTRTLVWPTLEVPRLLADRGRIVALVDGYRLVRLDPADGKVLWDVAIASRPSNRPQGAEMLVGEDVVYIQDGWMEGWRLSDGSPRWRQPLPESTGGWQVTASGALVFALGSSDSAASLLVWDNREGRWSQSLRFAGSTSPRLQVGNSFALVAGAENGWILAARQATSSKSGEPNE